MSVAIIVDDDYLRPCDICGRPRKQSEITIRDNVTICIDHPGFRTARELDRLKAKSKTIPTKPVKGSKPFSARQMYLAEEGGIFDLVTTVAPFETRDVSSDGAPGVSGNRSYTAAGWAILYLLAVYTEGKRPLAWRTRALAKARELGDFLISKQYGNGLSPTLTKSTAQAFGMLDQFQLSTSTDQVTSADQGIAAVAFCRLFTATAAEKYRYAAKLVANGIVNLMAGDTLAAGSTSRFFGPPTHVSFGASGTFDHLYYPGDLVCLWGLAEIKTIAGDGTYGADTTIGGTYTTAPQRLLSVAIAQMRAFWATGASDINTGTVINGMSTATPKEFYAALAGFWALDGGGVTSANWCAALRALYETEGATAQVTALYDHLRAIAASATFATPAGASTKRLLTGITGTFDATLAPTVNFDATLATDNAGSYDFAAAGLLAPLLASRNPGAVDTLKETLAVRRSRTFEGSPRDSRTESLLRLGRAGLSFQPYTGTNLFGAFNRQESVTRAAQIGFLFRYRQAFGGDE